MNHFLSKTVKAMACAVGLYVFAGANVQAQHTPIAATFEKGVQQGVIRVKFKPEMETTLMRSPKGLNPSIGTLSLGVSTFDALAVKHNVRGMRRVFPYDARYEDRMRAHGLHLWYEVSVNASASEAVAALDFNNIAEVERAEQIYQKTNAPYQVMEMSEAAQEAENSFDDELLGNQWHYNNTGQTEIATEGSDINAFKAWEIEAGKSNVVVAVHDNGFDVDHEDLVRNMWVNEAELNGEDGVDDDGNGYIDDVHGYSFSYDQGTLVVGDHGTHVAGTVAATNNNGVGVAGVAGGTGIGDGVRIMGLQTLGGFVSNTAASFVYAANNGAVISQNSWGYTRPGAYEQAVLDAIRYFIAEAGNFPGSPMKGGVVIFAAGNDNNDDKYYPGYMEEVISVSSLGADYTRSYFSNYGEWVDIAAPGGDMAIDGANGVLSTWPNDKYAFIHGTSMACPHVSGVAGLVVSKFGGPNYTAEDLKKQLLSSTVSIDEKNPEFVGKLGIGAIDAYLALQPDQGIAPLAVTDLVATGASVDFVTLEWTTTTDEDDVRAFNYDVYYSTSEITAENFASASMVSTRLSADTGAVNNFKVTELVPETNYFITVVAKDRFGNPSGISNVIEAMTNAGPDIDTDASIAFDLTDGELKGTGSFEIRNLDEGVLEWNASVKHKSTNIATSGVNDVFLPSEGTATIIAEELPAVTSVGDDLPAFEERTMSYIDFQKNQTLGIGNGDGEKPNSGATRFYVDNTYPNGFNLTDLKVRMRVPFGTTATIEVKKGRDIETANTVHTQEFSGKSDYHLDWSIKLEDQVYISTYDYFWVVVHLPADEENLIPLSIGRVADVDNAILHQKFSDSNGESWADLHPLLVNELGIVDGGWRMSAISKNDYLGEYISLSPSEGDVLGLDTTDVAFNVNADNLINGSYTSNIRIRSNDPDEKEVVVPVTINVEGREYELASMPIYDFGSVLVGASREMELNIANYGYGLFPVESIEVSNAHFELLETPRTVPARSKQALRFRFTPSVAGNENGVVSLKDTEGNKFAFNIFGAAVAPSEITIDQTSHDFASIALGDTLNGAFTLTNTGDYPLNFFMPRYAPDYSIEGVNHGSSYGYVADFDTVKANFNWTDISASGESLTEYFKVTENYYYEVDLGFAFPYFGKPVNKLYITDRGVLTLFDDEKAFGKGSTLDYGSSRITGGYFSAIGSPMDLIKGGEVFFQRNAGELIVSYNNVVFGNYGSGSIQFVVKENGDITMSYKDWNTTTRQFIAMESPSQDDGILIYQKYTDNDILEVTEDSTTITLASPGVSLVNDISLTSGLLQVGESVTIDYELTTDDLTAGNQFQKLVIASNDPAAPTSHVTFNVDITEGGNPSLMASTSAIDMGNVYKGATKQDVVVVMNEGTGSINVTDVSLRHGNFSIEVDALPISLNPKYSSYIKVNANTDAIAELMDTLDIVSADTTISVALSANVIEPPVAIIPTDVISATIEYGEQVTESFSISNDGLGDLQVSFSGEQWAYVREAVSPAVSAMELPEYTYSYKTNFEVLNGGTDPSAPTFVWTDLKSAGGTKLDHYAGWNEVELGFDFMFYGESYSKAYMAYNGLVSFTGGQALGGFAGSPLTLGENDAVNNIIAPLWARQKVFDINEDAGIYFLAEDDKVTFQWDTMLDFFGTSFTMAEYQLILFKSGEIKIQYKTVEGSRILGGEVVGTENADGTLGTEVFRFSSSSYKNGMVVTMSPSERFTIPAGTSKDFDMVFEGNVFAGNYTSNIVVTTNDPANASVNIPVELNVNGAPELVAVEDSIDFGPIVAVGGASYEAEFSFVNEGVGTAKIEGFASRSGNTDVAVEIWGTIPGFRWFPPQTGWFPESQLAKLTIAGQDVVPTASSMYKVIITPSVGEYDVMYDTIDVTYSDGKVVSMPITWNAIPSPTLVVTSDDMNVVTNYADQTETRRILIDNREGEAVIHFSMEVEHSRGEALEEVVAVEQRVSSNVISTLAATEAPVFVETKSDSELELNNELKYFNAEMDTVPTEMVGFGASQQFVSGTGFTAPQQGFNLSHVRTWYRPKGADNQDIAVTIRVGSDVWTAETLHFEEFTTETSSEDAAGSFMTFELSEAIKILPNEKFWVIFEYGFGVEYPQGTISQDEAIENRFMFWGGDQWYDITTQGAPLATEGWMVAAGEETAVSNMWLSFSTQEGEVAVGDSLEIIATFDASYALDADMFAKAVVTSNDVNNTGEVIDIHMHANQAPVFVDKPNSISVTENEVIEFTVVAEDKEMNAYTWAFEGEEFVTFSTEGDTAFFSMAPGFYDAGEYVMNLTVTDEYGMENVLPMEVIVKNNNNIPVVVVEEIVSLNMRDGNELEAISSFVTDVDEDDEVIITFEVADHSVAAFTQAGNEVVMIPLQIGETVVNFTADDQKGGVVTGTFTAVVDEYDPATVLSSDESASSFVQYPNPVAGTTYFEYTLSERSEVSIALYNLQGSLVSEVLSETQSAGAQKVAFDATRLHAGVYVYTVSVDGVVIRTEKMIKQ
ncbi:S8 family serine peptidase [Sediminitomix flava]|uniref:Putative secreted protein (Por secretion system target) n=1 Tax=Sediminitomix flava TaxID=379075 RepID=A0A315ZA56_SEDFL|nr:S8 family serine peptidase [Sediminitomix flava]PWJ40960.1 putative secreted protein (Por secretion system target) [Sediminitomix flava]